MKSLSLNSEWDDRFDRLVSESFGTGTSSGYLGDFPVWRSDSGADTIRLGIVDGSRLLASAAIRFAKLKSSLGPVSVGVIGGVATVLSERGKGHASGLIEELLSQARARSTQVVVLFGSEVEFYARLGFLPAGKQFHAPIADLEFGRMQSAFSFSEEWNSSIPALMRTRSQGFIPEASSDRWLKNHLRTRWFGVKDSTGRLLAFAAADRGIDLAGFVHDWGGDADALRSLFGEIERREAGKYQLLGPFQELMRLKVPVGKMLYDPLCLAQPLDAAYADFLDDESFWLWGLDGA